jgi:hypothetical protein
MSQTSIGPGCPWPYGPGFRGEIIHEQKRAEFPFHFIDQIIDPLNLFIFAPNLFFTTFTGSTVSKRD